MSRRPAREGRKKTAHDCCKYKLTLEYDGTGYSGWQVQKNARSIQGTLIDAAQKFFGGKVDIQGAGRTDAGVHALAQVAHLDAPRRLQPQKILQGLNDLLPAPINILRVEEAPADFHARHMAQGKSYLYLISRRRTAFGKRYVWWVKDGLDVERMRAAAEIFTGFHDFASFADKRIDKHLSTEVQIDRTEIETRGDLLVVRIVGSHFLWKMVRRLVGIVVEAGRGSLSPSEIEGMLINVSGLPARCTAPPSGLFLAQVLYKGDRLEPIMLPPLHGSASLWCKDASAGAI
jgi:tRNA pseudouridine38-40 synthase